MLDVFNIMNTPNVNVQTFMGPDTVTVRQWKTWQKPRGAKMVYMIAVGGGTSGGCGLNTAGTSGGGAGGGSGAQSTLIIPASFLPDTLYVQAGAGGQQPATLVSAAVGVAGVPSYVSYEPSTTLTAGVTVLFANGGQATGASSTGAGGTAGTAAVVATIGNMPLAGRGHYNFFAGQSLGAGGSSTGPTAGTSIALPVTGLMVTGGAGGGGSTTTAAAGGNITGIGLPQYFPTISGGTGAVTATPAGRGGSGIQALNFMMNYGGAGGGGATTTAGGLAGAGGDGAPGCGGGGAGGSNTTNATLARPGNGGPGFVIIMTW